MSQQLKRVWLPMICILTLAIACKKQEVSTETSVPTVQEVRGTGWIPDEPSKLKNLRVLVSNEFLSAKTNPNKGKGGNSGGTTTTTSTDATPPTITITSPAPGTVVSGTINITVSATDNVGVKSVSYSVDGAAIGSTTTAPFGYSWNTTTLADGVHTLLATAFDAAGNSSYYSIGVTKNTTVVTPPPPSSSGFSLVMPPVGNQGSEGSCVSFAVGYAARSREYYNKSGAGSYSYSSNIFSPEYLYNMTKVASDCGSGSVITTALEYIKANGICTWQTMPYTSGDCSLVPNSSQFSEAANFKISGYSGLYKSDVAGIKSMLNAGHPVIFGANIDNSFLSAGPGFIWKSYATNPSAGHAMVICGYDDSKNAWKIMNSWGTGWGDAGYGWIDYNFFSQTGGSWVFIIN